MGVEESHTGQTRTQVHDYGGWIKMKKALLASTALVGAALLTAPASAGTVGSGDSLALKLNGYMWLQASILDADRSDTFGRGYVLRNADTEIHLNASNKADNGITYGIAIELETNTNATGGSDEAWMFFSGDFGRVEMGDQDDAINRMYVHAGQTNKGGAGAAGGLTSLNSVFNGVLNENFIQRSDWQPFTTGDATKLIYITPRFSGFQIGAAFTPDSGQGGSAYDTDNNGSNENIFGGTINYTGNFDDVGVSASISYEHGENDTPTNEDLEFFGVGAKLSFSGFSVAANYHDAHNSGKTTAATATGTDAGQYWAVGAGYGQGAWGVSTWYSQGERDEVTTKIKVTRWGVGAGYQVAPGLKITADYLGNEHKNRDGTAGTSEDSRGFALTSWFSF